ncbi:ribonuclease Z [Microdochium nivale]|nr:ribonuclease Z [Microdochium nivale]
MWHRRVSRCIPSRPLLALHPSQTARAFATSVRGYARLRADPKDFFNGKYKKVSVINAKHPLLPHEVAYYVLGRHEPGNDYEPISDFGSSRRMLVKVQLATAPTADTPGSCVMLHFDNKRYIIGNISEGTQRSMTQRKISLNKAQDLFVSGLVDWRSYGGVIGAILTVADTLAGSRESLKQLNKDRKDKGQKQTASTAVSTLNLHGGRNLTHFLATARRFVFRKGLPLRPHEIKSDPAPHRAPNEPDWKDENINVWYVPVESSSDSSPRARKRSHEEYLDSASPEVGADKDIAATVVEQMFNSNWSMDSLLETTVHQARMPAKLFVRNADGHIKPYTGPSPGGATPLQEIPDIPVLVRQPWPGAMVTSLPRTKPSKQSMCYIVKTHPTRGKFNPAEALKHGVAKTDFKLLTSGQTVQGKDGIEVTPSMVLGATVESKGIAFIDLPDSSYVDQLVKRSEWSSPEIMSGIKAIYWSLGSGVIDDSCLQDFMQAMTSVKHIVCAPDTCPNMIAMESVATQAYKLHSIDPVRFPLPCFDNTQTVLGTPLPTDTPNYEIGRTGHTIQLAPQVMVQDEKIVPFPDIPQLAISDSDKKVREEIAHLTGIARVKVEAPTFLSKVEEIEADIPNRDVEVITLGTGSALPSKYRNVSATLVCVPGYGNYLLDCGENTLGQLRRVLGPRLPDVLKELKGVWISHLHADHHLGTASVLKAWHETTSIDPTRRLFVASHSGMINWLREYAQVEDFGFGRLELMKFDGFTNKKVFPSKVMTKAEQEVFGVQQIDACYVDHCQGALAGVLTWPSGLKIAYSGDCRPSDAFVQIGQGTTLLIHESTFDDELRGDAMAKKHSTMSEAIEVGRKMGARRILLTHFSQRYQKIANLGTDVHEIGVGVTGTDKARLDEVTLVAFDYMRVRLGDFRTAQAFIPAIQKLFEDVDDQ